MDVAEPFMIRDMQAADIDIVTQIEAMVQHY